MEIEKKKLEDEAAADVTGGAGVKDYKLSAVSSVAQVCSSVMPDISGSSTSLGGGPLMQTSDNDL